MCWKLIFKLGTIVLLLIPISCGIKSTPTEIYQPTNSVSATHFTPTLIPSLTPIIQPTATTKPFFYGVIVFASTSRRYSPLALLDLKSEAIKSLALEGAFPTWSPDGQRLAFVGIQSDIYINQINGNEFVRLTNKNSQSKGNLEWSPDDNFIVYSYQDTMSDTGIAIVNVDDHTSQIVAKVNGNAYSPTWSPDGKQIAFMSLGDDETPIKLWVIDLDERSVKLIKEFPFARGGNVDWSPDGEWLAIVVGKAPEKTDVVCNDIYLIKPDGNELTRLTEMIRPSGLYKCATHVVWSPDGNYLAFIGRGSAIGNIMYWGWQIYVLDLRSKDYFAVTSEQNWFITDIDWSYRANLK